MPLPPHRLVADVGGTNTRVALARDGIVDRASIRRFANAGNSGLDAILRDHCKQKLAAYKAPRSFEFVAELGRRDAGKINRQALARAREQEAT